MQETAYLRPARGEEPGTFEWLVADVPAASAAPRLGALAEAASACAGRRLVFLAPGESVLLTSVDIPARNRQRVMQALPFMLEDRLAQDIEQVHFAAGVRRGDGSVPAAVVERAELERWLAELRASGLDPDLVIPDVLAVPYEPGAWTVVNDAGMALVRTVTQGGFAIDTGSLPVVLSTALEEAGDDRPARLLVYDAGPQPADLEALAVLGIEVVPRELPGSVLGLMAEHAEQGEAINLLQGEYDRGEKFSRMYRPWLPVGITLALLLVLNVGVLAYDLAQLGRESSRLQSAIERVYLETFPEAQRVVNPRVQMERGLEALRRGGGASGGFLDMMRNVASPLRQTDGLVLQRASYRENRLDLALTIGDLQNLDGLVRRIADETAIAVEIQSATAVNGRIEARLQLRASP